MNQTPVNKGVLDEPRFRLAFAILSALTLLRVFVLYASPFNLGPDEAQYWDWSRSFAFGYFSKPPVIAWLIGLETSVCGNTEPCIRIASPLLHMATSLALFFLARHLFGIRTAFWSALIFATLPSIWFSSGIISTDVPLLFFWSVSLLAFYQCLETRDLRWAGFLGLTLGLAFMSKYAAVYFLLCGAMFLGLSPKDRWFAFSRHCALAGGLALLILAPNLIWNYQNDFSTVSHTAANANWSAELFNIESLVSFIADQFAIFGPFLFAAFVWAAYLGIKNIAGGTALDRRDAFLLSFTVPILVIVSVQSFISRANANWAALVYAGATIFTVSWLLRKEKGAIVVFGSFALHNLLGIALCLLILMPSLIEDVGLANAFKRVRGWDTIGEQVKKVAEERGSAVILTDDRLYLTELLYYARPLPAPLRIWNGDGIPENHYELTVPFDGSVDGSILLVARTKEPARILSAFDRTVFLKAITVPLGGDKVRLFYLYELEGFHGRQTR